MVFFNMADPVVIPDPYYPYVSYQISSAPALSYNAAMENSAVNACVGLIAEGIAQCPIWVIDESEDANGNTRKTYKRNHPVAALLRNPNVNQTWFEFIEQLVAHAALGPGGLAVMTRFGDGTIAELTVVQPGRWSQQIDPRTGNLYYTVTLSQNGKIATQRNYSASDVVFLRGLSLDGNLALASIVSMRSTAKIASSLEKTIITQGDNGGRPSGIVSFDGSLSNERRAELNTSWKDKFATGQGGIAILDMGAKFFPMTATAVDAQAVEMRAFQINEVCRYFRVQPRMINGEQIDDATMRNHVRLSLMPWFKRIEAVLSKALFDPDSTERVIFDYDDLMRGSLTELATAAQLLLGNGGTPAIASVNEVREMFDLDALTPQEAPWAQVPLQGGYAQADTTTPTTAPQNEP